MFLESKEQNYVKNKNNIDPQSSVISTNEAMTSSALNTRIAAMNVNSSNFQTTQQPQNSNLQTNQINNQMLSSSIDSTTTTTSSSSYSTSSSTNLLNTKQPNGFNSRDRTHLKLDLKDGDSFLNGNNINNNGISPLSLPISLLDSASLLLSPEKILLAAHHQQQQQQQQQQKLETPTPSTILFPKVVTSEQEKFAEGLQKALQEFQGKDTSLTHFPATSPSAVKLLLSLARTPSSPTPLSTTKSTNNLLQSVTVSPNNNITITNSTTTNNLNTTTLNSLQKQQTFDLPKILVNQQQKQTVLSNTVIDPSQTETANSIIAKRFMEYFQLNQAAAAISATSPTSSINFNSHSSQLHQNQQLSTSSSVSATLQPLLNTQTTSNNSGIQKYLNNTSFIKKEPNQPLNCDEQMEILIDTQMPNSCCPLSNDSNRHSSSISNESSPRMNGKMNVISNGNTLNGCDGVIELGEHDLKKLERKRARNRLAASKCRQRKLQRIADLEKQVEDERKREKELQAEIVRLQNVIKTLQEKLSGYRH